MVFVSGDRRCRGERPFLNPGDFNFANLIEGHHDLMLKTTFLYMTHRITRFKTTAHFNGWLESPLFLAVDTFYLKTTGQKETMLTGNNFQWILQTIINLTQKTGAKSHREHLAGLAHRIANGDTTGILKYLNVSFTMTNTQNFGLQIFLSVIGRNTRRTDVDHLVFN